MFLERFYHDRLAQASYLVGCHSTGEAVVIDPARHVEPYLETAKAEGLQVVGAMETHIHADFVSGSRELQEKTGAEIYLSAEGNDVVSTYTYSDGVTLLKEGDRVRLGHLLIEALHTPGHTPEHLTYKLTDTSRSKEPMGLFTGDFLFVGDAGRPDLLEKSVGVSETAKASAKELFHSLQRLHNEPGHLQIWPGHGAGSPCGKAMEAVPMSTLGFEKQANPAFTYTEESEFIDFILDSQPEPPPYFKVMKIVNRKGPELLSSHSNPAEGGEDSSLLEHLHPRDVHVIDVRMPETFSNGFIDQSLNLPFVKTFTEWAGWMLDYDHPIYIIASEDVQAEVIKELNAIGIDQIAACFTEEVIEDFKKRGNDLKTYPTVYPNEVASQIKAAKLQPIDVRRPAEWEDGIVPHAEQKFLGDIEDWIDDYNKEDKLVLYCRTGKRSAIGASILRNHGFMNVRNMDGGFVAWKQNFELESPVKDLRE
ncbi:MBL fold metallo-hydrolase [Salsuginibacillus kocurii]|uniref:MBL fold metallo-hydrolase n=1 Tax=Salsuginibacillus kocurii TaxID=427078 RepID=UPI00035EF4B6|nr:MBL fold metallo-hydrolase [Salsuginibacillus kocurii]